MGKFSHSHTHAASGLGAAPWTPATYGSLKFWQRADTVTMDGSNVASFTDKSGNAKHAVAPSAGLQGTMGTIAGQPAVVFSGSDGYVISSLTLSAFILWIVAETTTGDVFLYQHGDVNYGSYLLTGGIQTALIGRLGTVSRYDATTASWLTSGGPSVIRQEYNNSNATHKFFRNGVQVAASNPVANANTGYVVPANMGLGCNAAVNSFYTGKIAEAIAIPFTSDAATIALFEAYFADRYL